MGSIAIIPARKGSKRIKNKNIKFFYGKPVISYAINIAKKSKLFSEIIVSTDCPKIAKISIKYGAKIYFLRPKYLSGNKVGTIDVIFHAVKFLKGINKDFKYICCIYPVSPLIQLKNFLKCYNILKRSNYDYVFPVSKYKTSNQNNLILNENLTIKKKLKYSNNKRDSSCYYDTGQYYWGRINAWLNKKKLFSFKSKTIILKKNSFVDVNIPKDWKRLVSLYHNKFKK